MRTYSVIGSPLGDLTAVATDGVLSGLFMDGAARRPPDAASGARRDRSFDHLRAELAEYFAGERQVFTVPTAAGGSAFQHRVWEVLAQIPYGRTSSYGEIARALGDPRTVRAVGAANGRNPICILVPCHRVVGADGSLTGYAGGVERKELLLALENPARSRTLF